MEVLRWVKKIKGTLQSKGKPSRFTMRSLEKKRGKKKGRGERGNQLGFWHVIVILWVNAKGKNYTQSRKK